MMSILFTVEHRGGEELKPFPRSHRSLAVVVCLIFFLVHSRMSIQREAY